MTTYPNDDDGAVLSEFASMGVDMSKPMLIEFAVAAPNEASANAIHEALVKAGYDSEISYDEGEPDEDGEIDPDDEEFGPSWTIYATVSMIPEHKELQRIQADLDRLARPHDGNSDGWGAMLG